MQGFSFLSFILTVISFLYIYFFFFLGGVGFGGGFFLVNIYISFYFLLLSFFSTRCLPVPQLIALKVK